MRRQVHLERALGMSQVQLQRQRRHQQKGEGREQGEPVGGLYRIHSEHTLERRENERARHQARDEGVENDQDAPLELHLVRIHEAFNRYVPARASLAHGTYLTEPSMPL